MLIATKDRPLATTITGSLPRPRWFVANLDGRPFRAAIGADLTYREQYNDAVASAIADQQRAGLDIVSDGEMRFDMDAAGRSWQGYIFDRLEGLGHGEMRPLGLRPGMQRGFGEPGHILHDYLETKMPPLITGPIGPGTLQYDSVWKLAQRLTDRPVKMGSCSAQLVETHVVSQSPTNPYKDRSAALMAFSAALNEEYHRLADAGCAIIQVEEPCLHYAADVGWDIPVETYVEAFNREVRGLREKTELWCHTCWGNPLAQRVQSHVSYRPSLPWIDQLDADVLTFEAAENEGAELADIAAAVSKSKKICIGVVSHRALQVESPEQVAALIRKALKHIGPERLILSSDCGFGRQGMSRTHAFYKMVAIVRGTNLVRRELGLPEAAIPATEPRYALV